MINLDDEPIGFFTLPRELRDQIYGMVWQEHHRKFKDLEVVVRAVIPRVRLVSRQLKSEYDQSSPVNSFLHLIQQSGIGFKSKHDQSSPLAQFFLYRRSIRESRDGPKLGSKFYRLATQSRRLEVTWRNVDGPRRHPLSRRNAPDFNQHLRQLTELVGNLPFLEQVHVFMYFDAGDQLRSAVENLIWTPFLTSLVVQFAASLRPAETDPAHLAVWSREGGFLTDNMSGEDAV